MRLDAFLVQNGWFHGRDTAKQHIAAGEVTVNGKVIQRASAPVNEGDTVVCSVRERYVGRGGYKLEKALDGVALSLEGAVAMDVGASTGGFTDCMLQHGARKVYAVDVGHGQLHPDLRAHPSVVNLEGWDIRAAEIAAYIDQPPSVCSIDVSFISLRQVIPAVLPLSTANAVLICLIKPQFEAGREAVGKNGVVRHASAHRRVLQEMSDWFVQHELGRLYMTYSPIRGGEGNIEYLAVVGRGAADQPFDLSALVAEAQQTL